MASPAAWQTAIVKLGERLRAARLEKGLKGYQLAARVGTDSGTVSKWEHNRQKPRGEWLRRTAAALDVRMEWLLSGDEPKHPVSHGAIVTRLIGVAALDHVLSDYVYPPSLPTEMVDAIEAAAYEEASTEAGAARTPAAWRHRLGAMCDQADSRTRAKAR